MEIIEIIEIDTELNVAYIHVNEAERERYMWKR
jgi:hypothetical protein